MSDVRGGCLGKVDSSSLLDMLAAAGLGNQSRAQFRDAEFLDLSGTTTVLATSTDLVYDIGLAPEDFGWVAVTHAFSDIYAVLATPISATVCLGTPREALKDGAAARVLRGVASALAAAGARLGGGHTVYATPGFVSITVIGRDPVAAGLIFDQSGEYSLMLSKPLGSGLYIAAARNSLLRDADVEELSSTMRSSNAVAADSLRHLLAEQPDTVGFVTDVTGFGLPLCVLANTPAGWDVDISAHVVPYLNRTEELVSRHAMTTTLGERNMFDAEREGVDFRSLPTATRLALSDPQTSGGLIAAVRRDAVAQLEQTTELEWRRIGSMTYSGLTGNPKVSVL